MTLPGPMAVVTGQSLTHSNHTGREIPQWDTGGENFLPGENLAREGSRHALWEPRGEERKKSIALQSPSVRLGGYKQYLR